MYGAERSAAYYAVRQLLRSIIKKADKLTVADTAFSIVGLSFIGVYYESNLCFAIPARDHVPDKICITCPQAFYSWCHIYGDYGGLPHGFIFLIY